MLSQILVSDAFAQTADAAAATPEFSFTSFVPLILIFVVFYFLIIRPQSKKYKDQQAMIGNLKTGNKVITSSGIIGTVTEIADKDGVMEIEIATGVKVKILKSYVADLVEKKAEKSPVKKK